MFLVSKKQLMKPMDVTDVYWIFHGYSYEKHVDVGKWMLFWPNALLNAKWQAICQAWDEGQLLGVIGLKCSTATTSSNPAEGGIILHCNNSEDEGHIMEIGQRIALHLYDYPKSHIYYKTDAQTLAGTSTTTYRLELERPSLVCSGRF
jgi:hypothetical protein